MGRMDGEDAEQGTLACAPHHVDTRNALSFPAGPFEITKCKCNRGQRTGALGTLVPDR